MDLKTEHHCYILGLEGQHYNTMFIHTVDFVFGIDQIDQISSEKNISNLTPMYNSYTLLIHYWAINVLHRSFTKGSQTESLTIS